MFRSSWYFIFMLIGEAVFIGIKPYDMTVVSFSSWPENAIWDVSKLRMIGRERLLNGTVTLTEDMDNEHYSFSAETFSDASGDGNFKQLPFYIPRMPICEAYKKYRHLFSKHAEYGRQTDFPCHRDVCPIPKGTYYLKSVQISSENWPAVMPRGFLQIKGFFYLNDELVGTYTITSLVKDKGSR